jgi:hypothetical protein
MYIVHRKRIKVQEIHRREVALHLVELNMQKKLSALAVGHKAIICSLEDEELVLKLMEMGRIIILALILFQNVVNWDS